MPQQHLRDCRILIVEDEFLLAEDLRGSLVGAGAVVAGMASTVRDALALINSQPKLDAAILDVNLGGKPVFPIAERLAEQGTPFLFTTGYDASSIPLRFNQIVRCEKPFDAAQVVRALERLLRPS